LVGANTANTPTVQELELADAAQSGLIPMLTLNTLPSDSIKGYSRIGEAGIDAGNRIFNPGGSRRRMSSISGLKTGAGWAIALSIPAKKTLPKTAKLVKLINTNLNIIVGSPEDNRSIIQPPTPDSISTDRMNLQSDWIFKICDIVWLN
jgi:hypothetical protein